ncbi:hypothetical protein COV56_01010 [Candidatus Kuenenbacteria bacterium CG11_big_fil_rev_8_21_14_0_20_37_9]|uniref:Glycoside hydrolase family 57 N-terminal domain-containing protein n=2 Tax=Candidatus Kueneniibacteriota TaxID=1752740 RepID=A0A2M6XS39_9BACT|nr:MAG: hypothetical protein AUJ29_02350 [Candidatus Kuenenbacteria bacterium CG1_02_38_13]PIR05783.1 MAG: hypothetical protein COV56_01010 [Candidatus Kuenenbacteria bacterium CG11_big_fil_rev_8_21_14_0_20_37_9]PIU10464.1 MAG: hypothetical protein COT27_03035 [Candidatus Kuenenbacteria bacterium CG08_land_8_20_14_0_20_37_23]
MIWINILHIYQPPTLEKELLIKITKEAYLNIVNILKQNSNYKITLNIAGCLTEYLRQLGFNQLIEEIKALVRKGQIEMTGTAAFHPLLPLLPIEEVERQIRVNNDINKRYFGECYQPTGFYLPEMAYSPQVGRAIKRAGFKWIILDEIALDGEINHQRFDYSKKYKIKKLGLNVIFRDRKLSRTFVPEAIEKILSKDNLPEVAVTATDGELYGHKYVDQDRILHRVLRNKNIIAKTVSEFFGIAKIEQKVEVFSSSWESTPAEIQKAIPYALWWHPNNKIHKHLWRLAKFALKANYDNLGDSNHFASRLHMEKGLASCTFWWASGKDFKMFADPAWNPEEVEKGALELLRSVRALAGIPAKIKIKAEKIFLEIHRLMWEKHWKKNSLRNKEIVS